LLVLTAGLFFIAQSFSTAHASVHGEGPHDHDGVSCAVQILNEDQNVLTPQALTSPFDQNIYIEQPETAYVSYPLPHPQSRAPPPRAPPFSISL